MAADNSAGPSRAISGQTGQKLKIVVLRYLFLRMVFGRRRTFGSRRSVFRQEIFRLPRTAHPKARLRPGPDRFDQLTCPRNWARTADIGQVARRSYSYWGHRIGDRSQILYGQGDRSNPTCMGNGTCMAKGTGQIPRMAKGTGQIPRGKDAYGQRDRSNGEVRRPKN